jgi:hypothetical protein
MTTTATSSVPQTVTSNGVTLSFDTAQQIIDSALQSVGLDPNAVATQGVNQGQTLGQYFWHLIVDEGITDPTTIGEMVANQLPQTGQFQVAFPGYQAALQNGYVRSVAQYVSAEEGITAVLLQGGIPRQLVTPTYVGDLIANGNSVNEVADRVTNGFDQAANAPPEVQSYFEEEFGQGQGLTALATVFLNPEISDVTLKKMLAGAQIRGAAAAANMPISQGLSQRLADMGQTYGTAQAAFKNLQQQAGLFQQTVGEAQSQRAEPGVGNAAHPLSAQTGIEAAFGLSAAAMQQVHQAALAREDEFRGGGGAASSQQEGYLGQGPAKPF